MSPEPTGWELAKAHFAQWWKFYAGGLGVVYLFYKVVGPLGDLIMGWIAAHTSVAKNVPSVDGVVRGVLVVCSLVLLALLVLVPLTLTLLFRAQKAAIGAEKNPILIKTFDKTTKAADQIAKQLFPGTAATAKKTIRCKQVYTLYKNGDCHVTETLVITAKNKDIHFMEKLIRVEEEAEPVDFPDEIDLKVVSKTPNKEVAYLISNNEKRQKNAVVFFLPRIQAGQPPDQREIVVTYYWKGFFKRLIMRGDEPFENTIKSVDPIPTVEYEFWNAPDNGVLGFQNVGQHIDENDPTREIRTALGPDENGLTGWSYVVRDFPVGHVTRFRLTWRKN